MSGLIPETYGNIGPWQRYVARERAARDAYLATTMSAHREYLMGPWPDREAYQHVEHSAWVTYYAAGREAWRHYTAEITPPPPPPTGSMHVHPYPPERISGPDFGGWEPSQPTFSPTQESD